MLCIINILIPDFIKKTFIFIVNTPPCGLLRYCLQKNFYSSVTLLQLIHIAVTLWNILWAFIKVKLIEQRQQEIYLCQNICNSQEWGLKYYYLI